MSSQRSPHTGWSRGSANGIRRRARRGAARACTALLVPVLALLAACADNGTQPGTFRFGQDGEVRVRITTPLGAGAIGTLHQTLEWRSTGQWRLVERLSYRGQVGDSTVRGSERDAPAFASSYASLITLVNEDQGVNLFTDDVDPELEPECGQARSRVSVRILDERRGETVEWIRCAGGSFSDLEPKDAGPPRSGAARVVQVARLARDFVLGTDFLSAYAGTVPFASLARQETSADGTPQPAIFLGSDGQAPDGWVDFWNTHVEPGNPPPEVDWSTEMVIAATVGQVNNAGHEVEVRRILPVDRGTQVEVYHRIPGDFCSPASGDYTPFHVVVAPRTTEPVGFQEQVRTEEFTCGV